MRSMKPGLSITIYIVRGVMYTSFVWPQFKGNKVDLAQNKTMEHGVIKVH